jgi:hypothetical protein
MTKKPMPFDEMTPEQQKRFREATVAVEWHHYKQTKDRRHLANICREMPFFGKPEVGEEIARLLTLDTTLSPLKKKPVMDTLSQNATIKGLWLSWKDATFEDGKKIPERAIMHTIGKKVGIEGDDGHAIYETVRQRLIKMGLK